MVNVIFALPVATPLTTPLASTVAIAGLLEVHVPPCSSAFDGAIVLVSAAVAPTLTDTEVGATVTPVTATLGQKEFPKRRYHLGTH